MSDPLTKAALRAHYRTLRRTLPLADISRAIQGHLAGWSIFQTAQTVVAYDAMADEVSLQGLMDAHPEKAWYWPRTLPDGQLAFHRVQPGDPLHHHRFGLREPLPSAPRLPESPSPDLILVPGLAVDRYGTRLGFGKGFYDRWLGALTSQGCPVVGVFPAACVADTLPQDPWDVPLPAWLTESGFARASNRLVAF